MLTLFHSPQSRSTRFLWLLEEVGAPYQVRYVDIPRRDGSGAPDPANLHPDKKVPALEHKGALIFESAAIALYLTDAFPEAGVGAPVGDPLRGAYLTWLFYYAGVVEPTMVVRYTGGPAWAETAGGWGRPETMNRLILEALERGPYLLGERFTAADVLIGSLGQWARDMLPPGGTIDAWIARLNARPALARGFARDANPEAAPAHG